MAKGDNVVNAFMWACTILDTTDLTLAEQAILFNMLKLINRNFWKPVEFSAYKLAQKMGSDHRTIAKNIKSLIKKGILYNEGEEYYIGNDSPERIRAKFKRTGRDTKISKPVSKPDSRESITAEPTAEPKPDTGTLADFA